MKVRPLLSLQLLERIPLGTNLSIWAYNLPKTKVSLKTDNTKSLWKSDHSWASNSWRGYHLGPICLYELTTCQRQKLASKRIIRNLYESQTTPEPPTLGLFCLFANGRPVKCFLRLVSKWSVTMFVLLKCSGIHFSHFWNVFLRNPTLDKGEFSKSSHE